MTYSTLNLNMVFKYKFFVLVFETMIWIKSHLCVPGRAKETIEKDTVSKNISPQSKGFISRGFCLRDPNKENFSRLESYIFCLFLLSLQVKMITKKYLLRSSKKRYRKYFLYLVIFDMM